MKQILCAVAWALFALVSVDASAAAPVSGWMVATTSYGAFYGTTKDAACSATKAPYAALYGSVTHLVYDQFGNPQLPRCRITNAAGTSVADWTITPTNVCPDGSQVPSGGVCPDPAPTCTAGKTYEATVVRCAITRGAEMCSPNPPLPTSLNGCQITVDAVVGCEASPAGASAQTMYCTYRVKESGSASGATPGSDSTTTQPTDSVPKMEGPTAGSSDGSCPAGTVRIGTDSAGTPICAGSGTAPKQPTTTTTTKPSTTVTNPDGSTTKTDVTERLNQDGSTTTTTTTTTTAPNGTVTTQSSSITGKTPSGTSGKADGDPDKVDFCKQNPQLNVCQNSTISGACSATACTGDAITCEIARQQRIANCKRQEEIDALNASPLKALGDQIVAGNDPQKASLPSPGNASVVSVPGLNSNGFLGGGGTCLNDKPFTAGGMQFVIPFSSVCEHLEPMRYMMLIIAGLISLKLLRSSIFA